MSHIFPYLDEMSLEQIARLIGDTDEGLSHAEIDNLFRALNLIDQAPPKGRYRQTKWKRIFATLLHYRASRPSVVYEFVEKSLTPSGYISRPDVFEYRRSGLNELLAFAGLSINAEGRISRGKTATTLEAAAELADSILVQLRQRSVHPRVLRACDRELIQKNMFHGQLEATKSICDRIRSATGLTGDGAELIDEVFSLKSGIPVIAINGCNTESERSEHKGFSSLIKGALGMWRNTTAHELRLSTALQRKQVLDAMTTLSFIHWKLDDAILTRDGSKVP